MREKVLRLIFVGIAAAATFIAFSCYLVSAGLTLPLHIAESSSLLAQVFGLSGLIWIILYCGTVDSGAPTVKLIGSILVLALAFASNSAWTYALSIFIVATLVTELEFLEKLAALFTNRKEYWEWRSKQGSNAEAQKKAFADALDEENEKAGSSLGTVPEVAGSAGADTESASQPSNASNGQEDGTRRAEKVNRPEILELADGAVNFSKAQERAIKGLQFARRVTNALRSGKSPFGNADVAENMLYQKGEERLEIDAIVKALDIHYVVEIKYVMSVSLINRALWKVKKLADGYTDFLSSRGLKIKVQAVLILPDTARQYALLSRYRDVEIYFFDQGSDEFYK